MVIHRVQAGLDIHYVFSHSKLPVSSFLQTGRVPRRFVLILISSALAYTDGEIELNRILFLCFERKCLRCELWHVFDHYFNVCLGVTHSNVLF